MSSLDKFCFPLPTLQNDRIKLVPFKADLHAQKSFDLTSIDPSTYAHTANGPYKSKDELVDKFINLLGEDEYAAIYAIVDKTKPPSTEDGDGELVGMTALIEANDEDRSAEIGHVRTFRPYAGRGLATAAARLLLDHAFRPEAEGGLGLYRVEWHASTMNHASIAVAEKLGFEKIGTVRYERIFSRGKTKGKIGNGRLLPPGCHEDDLYRDLTMYAMYWNIWQSA